MGCERDHVRRRLPRFPGTQEIVSSGYREEYQTWRPEYSPLRVHAAMVRAGRCDCVQSDLSQLNCQ